MVTTYTRPFNDDEYLACATGVAKQADRTARLFEIYMYMYTHTHSHIDQSVTSVHDTHR